MFSYIYKSTAKYLSVCVNTVFFPCTSANEQGTKFRENNWKII